ncbi:MAG: hypothetical protein IKI21_09315 [Oscillospiraceae bacterium]|nr:hypothetical protein [Oscillospiraceae bacterium]
MGLRTILASVGSAFLLAISPMCAFAATTLPEGAVKGLPERLVAMDSDGDVVSSETGEYFFRVEGMRYNEVYHKDVQLMNLRDDKAYHIYFYVEPLWKDGEIDLEEGCVCTFSLDGQEFYTGTVTGDGDLDLTQEVMDCGYYEPGDSHTLSCDIVWNELDVLHNVNKGHRLVDKNGEHTLVGPDESGHVEGEIEFKWIFYAAVDEEYDPPETGLMAIDQTVWLAVCIILSMFVCLMLLLLLLQRTRRKKGKKT